MKSIDFPGDKDRISIVGATGSGKTQAAAWHLSRRNFNTKPWIIYDFKNSDEDIINQIQGAQELDVNANLPQYPGIYIVHPRLTDVDLVENQMWKIWERGNAGVFVDEGYMIGRNSSAFRSLLTQGRSKHIPMIVLTQRPVWVDRFAFSESQFLQIFRLADTDDLKTVNRYIPHNLSKRLPEFHSYYYGVKQNRLVVLKAVPDRDAILDTFDTRLEIMRKVI